jgi:phage tail sheath gpL-like
MSNALYGKGRQAFLEGSIAILTDDIKLCFVDAADYTLSINADDFLNDIPGAGIVATSGNFATKTSTLGTFDADDVVVATVSGDTFEYVVIYKDTGASNTSPLIALIDTATGLPFTPTGNNVTVAWDNGANKIFTL